MTYAVSVALLLLVGLLTLVSYVDRLYTEIGKFLSREFQDNIDSFEKQVEPRLRASRPRASLSMAILVPLVMAAIAMAVGFTVFNDYAWSVQEILQATLSLILIIVVFNRFLPFVFFSRTKGDWLVRWVWLGGALMAIGGLIVMWPQAERRRAQAGYSTVLQPAEQDV